MAKNPNVTLLDPGQIAKRVYDESEDRIRVDAQLNIGGSSDIVITHLDDSIKIGDGTKLVTATTVSGKNGIDANIIGGVVSGNFTSAGLQTGLKTTVMTVTSTAQALPVTPLANRNSLSVRIIGSNTVYFGDSNVTSSNGYPKYQNEEISLDIKDNSAVYLYAICAGGQTSEVRILELA